MNVIIIINQNSINKDDRDLLIYIKNIWQRTFFLFFLNSYLNDRNRICRNVYFI